MQKRLIGTFGPDGAGKSTLATYLEASSSGSVIVPATRPELWPDTSWHEETTAKGVNRFNTDPAYHITTLDRCFAMARTLLQSDEINQVILDPDPRVQLPVKAKVLHDYPEPMLDFYDKLRAIAGEHIDDDVRQINVHVTVGQGTEEERAAALMQRLDRRGASSEFDPKSLEQSRALLVAYDSLATVLAERGNACLRIETDTPFDTSSLNAQLADAA